MKKNVAAAVIKSLVISHFRLGKTPKNATINILFKNNIIIVNPISFPEILND